MYQITLDGQLIHDVRSDDLQVIAPKLLLEANKIGSLTFAMHEAHEFYGQAKKLKSVIAVYKDGAQRPMFKARVLDSEQTMNNMMTYQCEELTAYLLDSVMRPFQHQGGFADFFRHVLGVHNAQVEPYKQIKPGRVTVTDANDYINRSSIEYLTCWDVLVTRLVNTHGGYLRMRHEDDGMYLDYLAGDTNSLSTAMQPIEFGENMMDLSLTSSAADTFTVCIPLGYRIEDTDTRLTIESVNNGLDYIVNEEARAQYGWIVAPVSQTIWEDVTLPSNLLKKGQEYLNTVGVTLLETLTLTALDLHNANADIEGFNFLDFVRVHSSRHDIDATYILTRLELPLSDPTGARITLGNERRSLTDTLLYDRFNAKEQINEVKTIAQSGNEQVQSVFTLIAQTEDALLSLIGYTETRINSTNELVDLLDGEVNRRFEEYARYLRFADGKFLLGKSGNPFALSVADIQFRFMLNQAIVMDFKTDSAAIGIGKVAEVADMLDIGWQTHHRRTVQFDDEMRLVDDTGNVYVWRATEHEGAACLCLFGQGDTTPLMAIEYETGTFKTPKDPIQEIPEPGNHVTLTDLGVQHGRTGLIQLNTDGIETTVNFHTTYESQPTVTAAFEVAGDGLPGRMASVVLCGWIMEEDWYTGVVFCGSTTTDSVSGYIHWNAMGTLAERGVGEWRTG